MRVRELVRQTCEAFEIRIIKGVVSKDHVHIRECKKKIKQIIFTDFRLNIFYEKIRAPGGGLPFNFFPTRLFKSCDNRCKPIEDGTLVSSKIQEKPVVLYKKLK